MGRGGFPRRTLRSLVRDALTQGLSESRATSTISRKTTANKAPLSSATRSRQPATVDIRACCAAAFAVRKAAKKRNELPQGRKRRRGRRRSATRRHFAEQGRDQVEAKQSNEQPVEAADNHQDKRERLTRAWKSPANSTGEVGGAERNDTGLGLKTGLDREADRFGASNPAKPLEQQRAVHLHRLSAIPSS